MRNVEGLDKATEYLNEQLPSEEHGREVEQVFSDNDCTVYEASGVTGVFFINHTGGWCSTDNVRDDYPEVYDALISAGVIAE